MKLLAAERRPWGWMLTLIGVSRFWIKLIRVHPGRRTSLQLHKHRAELHISRRGFTFVEPYTLHRMTGGWYIELAFGRPREDDIVRTQDDFNRFDQRRL